MPKSKYFNRGSVDQNSDYAAAVNNYRNIYYNLYRANFKWHGLNYRQEDYIMRKFWGQGTVAAFKIGGIDEIGFAPWTVNSWDMYDLPETVTLVNERGVPFIPTAPQVVDEQVCLGYIQRNKKPLFMTVDWYIQRIAQVDMVINTNLNLHKMPFILPIEREQEDKARDVINRILNNEIAVFAEGFDLNLLKAVVTSTPYIIDRLQEYKTCLTNELKTYLGVDNQGAVEKREQLQLDEINSNNDEINDQERNFLDELTDWCRNIKNTFGIEISVEGTSDPVVSEGERHTGAKPGPKEGEHDNAD